MDEADLEADRLIAVVKGDYVARHFPDTWYAIQKKIEAALMYDVDAEISLKEQLQKHIAANEANRANRRK